MLSQIELYQKLPEFRSAVKGFIDESAGHLSDCQDREDSIKRKYGKHFEKWKNADPVKKELTIIASLRSKYGNRLSKANKTLESLSSLQRCLDE